MQLILCCNQHDIVQHTDDVEEHDAVHLLMVLAFVHVHAYVQAVGWMHVIILSPNLLAALHFRAPWHAAPNSPV
jgi:hypothetical protein